MGYQNAVLEDKELQKNLKSINSKFGDLCIPVAGEVWGLPLIDQKKKALITIAVDVVNQDQTGPGSPFAAHVHIWVDYEPAESTTGMFGGNSKWRRAGRSLVLGESEP